MAVMTAETRGRRQRPPIEGMGPVRVAFLGVAVYVVLFLVAPVTVVTPQSVTPYLYIGFCYSAFFCGCIVARGAGKAAQPGAAGDNLSDTQLLKIHRVVVLAAALGAALKLIDVFVVRHVSLAGSVVDRRNDLDSVGANPVSIACAVLMPACLLVPYTFQLLRKRGIATRSHTFISHSLFLIPVISSVLIGGGRSMAVVYIVIYALYLSYFGKIRLSAKGTVKLLCGVILMLAASTAIFNNRLQAMNLNPLDSVYSSGYAFTLQPQTWITQFMQNSPGFVGDMAFAVLMTCQYYLHGIFEFVYQYQNAPAMHIWGAASFNAYYKLVAYITGWPSAVDLWNAVSVRVGVYTSFFGPVFSDFGWFGIFYMTALGAVAQRLWDKCRQGKAAAVPLYLYLTYTIFLFPVANAVAGNQGLYSISALTLFFLIVPDSAGIRGRARVDPERGIPEMKGLEPV